ncbi:MAG: DUF3786 domain-containing protein [Thermodesulfobacteriota bacterium]
MSKIKNPLELYKILPQSNCGKCFFPTCLAFAAAVIKGEKQLADCPELDDSTIEAFARQIDTRAPSDWKREEVLASLKKQIAALDLSSSVSALGGKMIGDKLSLRCLGKEFLVDPEGNVTSECHTHAGLIIPLLSYILQSKGPDISGDWLSFRELRGGSAMNSLFRQRGELPLKQLADSQVDFFEDLVSLFSGEWAYKEFSSDIAIILYPLPKVPMLICYWKPEEDLKSVLNIFFDLTADRHLSIESIYSLSVGFVMMLKRISLKHC